MKGAVLVGRSSAGSAGLRGALSQALVAGGVIAAYRASMVALDQWDYVRQALWAGSVWDERWLDAVSADDWVELDEYIALLEAIEHTIGVEELRSLTRRRIIDPAGSNFYSPMLRSWARSFGDSPAHMLRGAVHVWRAAQRNSGTLRACSVASNEVHLLVDGEVASAYRASPALAASLEGLALGFLDMAQPRPVFLEVELATARDPLALVCRFDG
jgi:hypothetical protein